jgi:hypothetical protein
LKLENTKLKEEKKRLEQAVKVLCKQNLQYSELLSQHKAFGKEVRKEMDRTMSIIASVLNMQLQNYSKMRTIEKQAVADWEEFCSEMKVEEVDLIEEVLEDVREEETGEIIIGMEFMI